MFHSNHEDNDIPELTEEEYLAWKAIDDEWRHDDPEYASWVDRLGEIQIPEEIPDYR